MSGRNRRQRKAGRRQWKRDESDYDSDDPRSYQDVQDPDPSSRDYYYDEVDEFHHDRDKILINEDQTFHRHDNKSDDEEEVLGWDEDDSEEELERKAKEFQKYHHVDEMGSDLEDAGEDEGDETDDKAWGKRRKLFHGTDFVGDNIMDNLQEDEEEEQAAEEEEARMIQRRMAEALDEGDFTIDTIETAEQEDDAAETNIKEDKVKRDLSKLSKKEKLQLLKKESPEMLELMEDCKAKLLEVKDQLQPLMDQVKSGKLPEDTLGVTYLKTKYHLYLNYCLNINFYMAMKAKQISVKNHPVIGRILSYRKLINELKPADEQIKEEMDLLLSELCDRGKKRLPSPEAAKSKGRKNTEKKRKKMKSKKKLSAMLEEDDSHQQEDAIKRSGKAMDEDEALTKEELKALEYYKKLEAQHQEKKSLLREMAPTYNEDEEEMDEEDGDGGDDTREEDEDQNDEDEKRAITYQISKNKGLTTRKKKELRNPRVKHRNKFRKAKIRRKGQVQEARTEVHRYGGELSGIRAGVVKSIKLK